MKSKGTKYRRPPSWKQRNPVKINSVTADRFPSCMSPEELPVNEEDGTPY